MRHFITKAFKQNHAAIRTTTKCINRPRALERTFSFSIPAGKRKRYTKLIKQQNSIIEKYFALHLFPNQTTMKEIALQTGLNESQVYFWFVCTRCKIRKGKCEGMPSTCKYIYMYINNTYTSTMSLFVIDWLSSSNMSIKYTSV